MPNNQSHNLIYGRTAGGADVPVRVDSSGVIQGSGGGVGSDSVTIADGSDATEGAISDAAVVGDANGTVSAKLRGLSKILNDVWVSASHYLKVNVQNATLAVTQSGVWTIGTTAAVSSTATLSNVASSASSVTLLSLNASRIGMVLYNDSNQSVNVKYGTTASSTSFTYRLLAGQTLEMSSPIYTGRVDAIWDSANGSMRVTEFT